MHIGDLSWYLKCCVYHFVLYLFIWLLNVSSVHDEGYSRDNSYAVNYISECLPMQYCIIHYIITKAKTCLPFNGSPPDVGGVCVAAHICSFLCFVCLFLFYLSWWCVLYAQYCQFVCIVHSWLYLGSDFSNVYLLT